MIDRSMRNGGTGKRHFSADMVFQVIQVFHLHAGAGGPGEWSVKLEKPANPGI